MGAGLILSVFGTGSEMKDPPHHQTKVKFPHILKDGELNSIIVDFEAFREVSPAAYEKFLQNVDKFAGIVQLILSFSGEKKGDKVFDAGWSISAHHYSENVRESISAIEFSILDSMKEKFARNKKELIEWIDNTLYNVNMHTETIVTS